MRKALAIALLVVLCFALAPINVKSAGTVYYVSTTGNDANSGTLASPFRTIRKGISSLSSGSILYIRGGTYFERISLSLSNVTISGYMDEKIILDGRGLDPNLSLYTYIVDITGSYDTIQNLELTYPKARGVRTGQNASHNTLSGLIIHDMWGLGIKSMGGYTTIQNNTIFNTVLSNQYQANGDWSAALAIGDTTTAQTGANSIVRGNKVFENYGEGIITMYSDNALIENNIVYDNWAENIYLANSSHAIVRNNLTYYTLNKNYWRSSTRPDAGIMIADENQIAGQPLGHARQIYNNLIINTGYGIYFWTGRAPGAGLKDDLIAYNTIVSNYNYYGISLGSGSHSNTLFENNIILDNAGTPLSSSTFTGLTFTHNLWSKTPSRLGQGDIVANPLLANSSYSIDTFIDPTWYSLTFSSPAIDKALDNPIITTDYSGLSRPQGAGFDIGAYEFPSSNTVPTPTSTPVFVPTTITPTFTFTKTLTPTRTFTPTFTSPIVPTPTNTIPIEPTRECIDVKFSDGTVITVCK